MTGRSSFAAALLAAALLLHGGRAQAHKVNVFAVAQAGALAGEGYFANGSKARDCPVELRDASGRVAATARTGRDGAFRMELPPGLTPPLTLTLKAGDGHQADYTLTAADLGPGGAQATAAQTPAAQPEARPTTRPNPAQSQPGPDGAPQATPAPAPPAGKAAQAGSAPAAVGASAPPAQAVQPGVRPDPTAAPGGATATAPALPGEQPGQAQAPRPGATGSAPAQAAPSPGEQPDGAPQARAGLIDEARLQALVERATAKAVEEQLAPLRLELARLAAQAEGSRVRDVAGGLGWIAGLAGLAAWLKRRR